MLQLYEALVFQSFVHDCMNGRVYFLFHPYPALYKQQKLYGIILVVN